jgi:hypothetical protein
VYLSAGNDLTLVSSRVSAGDEAYLVAGNNIELLAAQDADYSLYDKKKKGSFGQKETRHDEVTDVVNVGSQIKTGGDLRLISGGDQRYQGAKLESGKDLTLDSGGSITFEAVKDLHQESHEKSSNSLAWNSAKGKGNTDETFRQSELVAQGKLAIRAAGKITIDLKQIDQKTVSETINAMVKAEPELAWIKQAEANGQVDWRLVKEIHESWKYDNAGLGAASALVIAIVASIFLGPLTGAMATNFTVGTVNNGGDLGAGLKATVSKDAIKGYATQLATGYALNGLDEMVSGWNTSGALILKADGIMNPGYSANLLDWNTVSQNLLRSTSHALVAGTINTAINGGSLKDSLGSAFVSEGLDLGAAFGNKQVGDLAKYLDVDSGSASKILMHAILGGALSAAKGGDFATGALAGAAAEGLTEAASDALGRYFDSRFATDDQFKIGAAQIIGVLAGAIGGGDVEIASWVAGNAEKYNRLLHKEEQAAIDREIVKGEFNKERLEKAACYTVQCWNGFDRNSAEYQEKYLSEADMVGLSNELTWVDAQKDNGLFGYTYMDGARDFTGREFFPIVEDGTKVVTGGITMAGGTTLCLGSGGAGCVPGSVMFTFGLGNVVDGGVGLYNRYYSNGDSGFNPVKGAFEYVFPVYGSGIYSAVDLMTAFGAGFVKIPLVIGVADGMNRPKSIFGVMKDNMDKDVSIVGYKFPYWVPRVVYANGVAGKVDELNKAVNKE